MAVCGMLNSISSSDAERLRDFLLQSGYAEDRLREKGYFTELPSTRLRNFPRLLDRTQATDCLNILLRWFWLGVPQEASSTTAFLPVWFIDLALSCGLLYRDGDRLASEVMLFPVDGFLVVCDHTVKIDASDPEFVLWPNPTSRLLSRFTVRRPSQATLDLGTGNGIQALSAAAHSAHVVATDLNPRAVTYAKFTARLNGLENIECLPGDGFEPVAGRKFDLIVSNPPFFISPSGRYLFCDNSMDLDQLCRRFVREAPNLLNEDGYFQLLCEWTQVKGQSWQERVTEWLADSGCDAWILKGHTQDPSEYAQHRIAETAASPEQDAERYASYMAYYRERKVEAIHDGIIAMRRRSGHNWVLVEEVTETPKDPFGESVLLTFGARDFLQSHASDAQMMAVKPRLTPHARLEQFFQPADGRWQPSSLNLRLMKGFPFFVGLQPPVAGFLSGCDGARSVSELIQDFARQVDAPLDQVQTECLGILRKLIERGFLLC
jgi:cyclopropane fatty-acyl-phospholipid synthase-like methyltransferase